MESATVLQPSPWMILPFVGLLALLALAPLLFSEWWGKHYAKCAIGLGAITLTYYLRVLHSSQPVLHAATEYVQFIALIGSLFVVSGGIHIRVKGEATPGTNVVFLFIGAVLANVLGTTGASMLLIRPWLRMNKYRVTAHHVVFFIFIVSNVGGCLTPIGDPPLFLGYLKGIPFWWVALHCWPIWATGVAILLAMFYVVDLRNYRRAPKAVREALTEAHDRWHFDGWPNVGFLALILVAVFIQNPLFLREGLMGLAALGSYLTTRKEVYAANDFNFHPIEEVAILFIGVFATMIPALELIEVNARSMGHPAPAVFFWSTGLLSSVLDNAPTYLSFLKAIFGAYIDVDIVQQVEQLVKSGGGGLAGLVGPHAEQIRQTFVALKQYHGAQVAAGTVSREEIEIAFLIGNPAYNNFLLALSAGAVFFGANTYIGNGPNFMVKSIASHHKVHTPTFLGYIWGYTVPFMLPMLVIIWLLFFR